VFGSSGANVVYEVVVVVSPRALAVLDAPSTEIVDGGEPDEVDEMDDLAVIDVDVSVPLFTTPACSGFGTCEVL
jgi:hypothetical protein